MSDRHSIFSLLILTLLLSIGLFFFIKASVKQRIEEVLFFAAATEEALLPQLQNYFDERAYRVTALNSHTQQITFEGTVRPSKFLAAFLSLLAALGLLCWGLVFSTLWTDFPSFLWSAVGLSPAAGLFYWKAARRIEQVQLQVQPLDLPTESGSRLRVRAHRDELAQLQKALPWLTREQVES